MGPLRIVEGAGYENYLLRREDKNGKTEMILAHVSFLASYHTPESTLDRAAKDLEEQLEHEGWDAQERNEPTVHATVRTAAVRSQPRTQVAAPKRARCNLADTSATAKIPNRLVELRRRKRRDMAGRYVLEFCMQPIDTAHWTVAARTRWIDRAGRWQTRWINVAEYDELHSADRVVEDSRGGEVV